MEVKNLPERLRDEADYLHHLAAIDFSRQVAENREAADEIERLRAIPKSAFKNDPFAVVMEVFGFLWPNFPAPFIQWLPPGELHVNDGDPWGCFVHNDDEDDTFINVDLSISVYDAIEVLAHELAHCACWQLGLNENENESHGKNWEECFDAINEKYNELQEGEKP
jgi:hypothetical protein